MKRTKTEKKSMSLFLVSFTLQMLLIIISSISVNEQIVILGALSMSMIMLNSVLIFYWGYSYGWELKRIHMKLKEQ